MLGWLLFGPRRRITENTLLLSLIWPVLSIAWTFAHGAAAHWYPYPFINVDKLGYVDVIRNGLILNLVLIGVGALYLYFDHRLPATPREIDAEPEEPAAPGACGHAQGCGDSSA